MKTFSGKFVIAISLIMLINISISMAQTSTIKHIVDRGETLESIAKKYGTTQEKIIEINPEAGQFVYVGMELRVPTVTNQTDTNKESVPYEKDMEQQPIVAETPEITQPGYKNSYENWTASFAIGYGFIPKAEGADGSSYTYTVNLGANYNITNSFYVGARIGYTGLFTSAARMNTKYHMISLPTEVGYRWFLSESIALVPHAGLDFNCALKGTMELGTGSNKTKTKLDIDNRLGVNGRIGLKINIRGFTVGGSYILSLDKNFGDNDGYPEISIGCDL